MSVKNGLPYVQETIDSIIHQSFSGWELVVVDNASGDGTGDYIERRAQDEPRIRLLRNSTDLGHSGGLNRGLAACRGMWIARIDADDRALPQRLERQLAFVRAHREVKVTSCLAYYIDANGRRVGKTYHDLTSPEAFRRYMATNEAIGILHPGALIERATLLKVGGYRVEFDPANDIDLWARISEHDMILVQPDYLMEYRVHPGAGMAQSFLGARMKYDWSRVCMKARRSSQPEPTWEEFLAEWNNQPWLLRLNRWRKITAKRLYRQAALHWITGPSIHAALEFGSAVILQPSYTIPRWKGQLLR